MQSNKMSNGNVNTGNAECENREKTMDINHNEK